jgi:hypothetical protein
VLVALVVVFSVLVPGATQAKDAPGCEGLEQFRADIMPIGEKWADELDNANLGPSRSPITFSSDDWTTYAGIALSANKALKTVDAPDWLEDWLQVRIEATGIQEQIGKAAAEGGVFVILGFEDQVNDLDKREDDSKTAAIARCADFEQFAYDWDALDGEVDGTPVATPER